MSEPKQLAELLGPIIRLELASIGAIESASSDESQAFYVVLFHEAKTSKQASVEQMNTVLRLAGESPVKSGGLIEPVLRLHTLALQKASTTALLGAMRLVENVLLDRYEAACNGLAGLEGGAAEVASRRARKRWMILTAHIAQRKDGESSHANELPNALSDYFANGEDRVCMRCLLDRPGAAPSLERQKPYTYVCAACHAEAKAEFPVDLQRQMARWREQDMHDRVIHKALGRPMKLKAMKEVHSLLAGLRVETTSRVAVTPNAKPAASATGDPPPDRNDAQPASERSIPADGASAEEASYTTLLFDYRSVRNSW